jgi:hypothetical protein
MSIALADRRYCIEPEPEPEPEPVRRIKRNEKGMAEHANDHRIDSCRFALGLAHGGIRR